MANSIWDYEVLFLLKIFVFIAVIVAVPFSYIDSFGYIDILRRASLQQLSTWKHVLLMAVCSCLFPVLLIL